MQFSRYEWTKFLQTSTHCLWLLCRSFGILKGSLRGAFMSRRQQTVEVKITNLSGRYFMCTAVFVSFVCSYVPCILKVVWTLDCVQAVGCFVGLIPGDFLFTKFDHCIDNMPCQLMHNVFAFIIYVTKKWECTALGAEGNWICWRMRLSILLFGDITAGLCRNTEALIILKSWASLSVLPAYVY